MVVFLFFFMLVLLTYSVCGIFTYYLGWNRTPTQLIELVVRTKNRLGEMPYYLLEPLLVEIFFWPFSVKTTWKVNWAIPLRRLVIIIFLSLVSFVMITATILYFAVITKEYVGFALLEYMFWISSGIVMYMLASIYTNNREEALSSVGVAISLIFLLTLGPFAYRKIYDMLKKDIEDSGFRTLRSVK